MIIPECVQPIRAAVFESDPDRVRRLDESLVRLGGRIVVSAMNLESSQAMLRDGRVLPSNIDVAFIGSYPDGSTSSRVMNQLLMQGAVRNDVGPIAPLRRTYPNRYGRPAVSVGMDTDAETARRFGSYSEYLGGPLAVDWTASDLGLPAILLEVMNLKPLENPNRNRYVYVEDPKVS